MYILIKNFFLVYMCYKKLSWIYQEILAFYYFKNSIKKVPQNGENANLVIKNPRASRALRQALDSGQLRLTSFARLCAAKSAKRSKIFSLVPPLYKKLATALYLQVPTISFPTTKRLCSNLHSVQSTTVLFSSFMFAKYHDNRVLLL